MTQNTLLAPAVNSAVQSWIRSNSNAINSTAAVLGISPTSIALSVSEEASHIVSVEKLTTVDEYGRVNESEVTVENFKDHGQDVAIQFYPDSFLTQNLFNRATDIVAGVKPSGATLDQLQNPTMMDVGWANLNVGNSILTLQQYLVEIGPGGRYEGDPLELEKYANNYNQFATDIATNQSVTFKIAGLNLASVDAVFERSYGDQYTGLPQDQRDAYLVTGYKQGAAQIEGHVSRNTIDGVPTLQDPSVGDGGNFALRNYPTIKSILDQPSGSFSSLATNFSDPVSPLTANGILPGYSVLNGAILDTESGQMAFLSPNGLSDTTTDWASYFSNNNVGSLDISSMSGLNQTTSLSSYSTALDYGNYTPTDNPNWDNGGSILDNTPTDLPVVLDLTGQGINITQLGSSSTFVDMTGSGYQNRTAWAGAGNGVLVLDLNGNGAIDSPNEFEFTDWDPTATSDMQALRDVFDTNHDGMLDAGDANFAAFKVMVTNADGTTRCAPIILSAGGSGCRLQP